MLVSLPKYVSYDVKGKRNFVRYLDVIPASTVSVSRSYEENGPKLLSFSVVAVGTTGANALSGEGSASRDEASESIYGFGYSRETMADILSPGAYNSASGEVI